MTVYKLEQDGTLYYFCYGYVSQLRLLEHVAANFNYEGSLFNAFYGSLVGDPARISYNSIEEPPYKQITFVVVYKDEDR